MLETMGIVESFNTVIHVPCLSSTGQLTEVLQVSLRVVFLYIWINPDIKYTMIDELLLSELSLLLNIPLSLERHANGAPRLHVKPLITAIRGIE